MQGQQLGAYVIDAELGSGGMGRVVRATGPDGVVALKVVHPHLLETPGFLDRFQREAEIGLAVRHPNVVRTHAYEEIDGAHVLVMGYVEGQTLGGLQTAVRPVTAKCAPHAVHQIELAH